MYIRHRKHNIAAYGICLSQSNFKFSIRGEITVNCEARRYNGFYHAHVCLNPLDLYMHVSSVVLQNVYKSSYN